MKQRPDGDLLQESLITISYGHAVFSDGVAMPDRSAKVENAATLESGAEHSSTIKKHPIVSDKVYFSGVSEVNVLPHESPEAIKNYEHQLQLQNRLQNQPKFNPKPNNP